MPKTSEWPPPEVKRLVLKELPEGAKDAEWPTWKETDQKIRKLGRQLLNSTNGVPLLNVYPIMAASSRGGLHVANLLSRPFGYGNPNIRYIGMSSYIQEGTEQGGEFLYGHLPVREDIEGINVLLVDEVCDTGESIVENKRILIENLGATSVTTAVLDFKPERSKESGVVPDFYVATTEKWIVYPWEPYEILGERALDEAIWRPAEHPW